MTVDPHEHNFLHSEKLKITMIQPTLPSDNSFWKKEKKEVKYLGQQLNDVLDTVHLHLGQIIYVDPFSYILSHLQDIIRRISQTCSTPFQKLFGASGATKPHFEISSQTG